MCAYMPSDNVALHAEAEMKIKLNAMSKLVLKDLKIGLVQENEWCICLLFLKREYEEKGFRTNLYEKLIL